MSISDQDRRMLRLDQDLRELPAGIEPIGSSVYCRERDSGPGAKVASTGSNPSSTMRKRIISMGSWKPSSGVRPIGRHGSSGVR